MSLAGSLFMIRLTPGRRPFMPVSPFVIGVAAMIAAILVLAAVPAPPVQAAGALTVEVSPGLSLVGETITLRIGGLNAALAADAELVVRVGGPAEPSQVGQPDPQLPEAAVISGTAGTSIPGQTAWSVGPSTDSWTFSVILPGDTLPLPGGYLVDVELRSGGVVGAAGSAWLGRVASRDRPLDVAFVLPVALGVHRDSTGTFFDQVLEQAVASSSETSSEASGSTSNDLHAVAGLSGRFPDWRFTLAIEPILLTQLQDMTDGFVRRSSSGASEEVSADDPAAMNAAEVVAAFKDMAGRETVEMAAGPYSGAALGALAAEGWRDGFDQLQLGKQELQQILGLQSVLNGAYSPDLDMTTGSLAYYGQASIDHVVVDEQLAQDLNEPVVDGTVAARVRDTNNDRVTLVFTNSRLRSLMVAPWDPGVFFAGLAAELAAIPRDAVVIVPGGDYVVPPSPYLEAIGESLTEAGWVETHTLTSLLRAHAPDTRPVLLTRSAAGTQGYIEGAMLSSLRAAHAAVADLAAATDVIEGPVENALGLLYTAESRWWWHPQTSPQVASVGLAYAEQALTTAQGELDKVVFTGAAPARIIGQHGMVTLGVDNEADYPLAVEVLLTGEGLTFPDRETIAVELQPGGNEVPVEVMTTESPCRLDVRLTAGSSTLDQGSHSLSTVTVMTILPWAVLAAVVVAAVTFAVLRLRRRKARA